MKDEYVIHQSVDEKTLIKASRKILFGSRLIIYIGIFALIVCVNVWTTLANDDIETDLFTYIPLAIPFFVIGGVWYSTRKAILKNYNKNPRYYNNITITLSRGSIKIEGTDYYNANPWENYLKIKETKEWFLIYVNKHQAHIIDKAQIKEFSIDELRQFLKSLEPKVKVSLK